MCLIKCIFIKYYLAINICESNLDDCHQFATCAYTGPGTYKCTCNKGYTGDGKTCTGKKITRNY